MINVQSSFQKKKILSAVMKEKSIKKNCLFEIGSVVIIALGSMVMYFCIIYTQ
jgi:hypothetical protein